MNEYAKGMSEGLHRNKTAHIFYCSHQLDKYVENAISYIVFGIKKGDYVLFVENTRIYPMIRKALELKLTAVEMEQLLYINNFDFYWRNGNFHPPTILNHFKKATGHLLENGKSVRTWGHIEWGAQEDIEREIVEYEKALDTLIPENDGISVCAYDALKVSATLKAKLLEVHGFYMTDEKVHDLALSPVQ